MTNELFTRHECHLTRKIYLNNKSPHTEIHDSNDDRKSQRISECGEEKMCRLGYKQEIWCAVQKINWYPGGEILTSKLFSRDSIFGLVFDRIYRTTYNLIRFIGTFYWITLESIFCVCENERSGFRIIIESNILGSGRSFGRTLVFTDSLSKQFLDPFLFTIPMIRNPDTKDSGLFIFSKKYFPMQFNKTDKWFYSNCMSIYPIWIADCISSLSLFSLLSVVDHTRTKFNFFFKKV